MGALMLQTRFEFGDKVCVDDDTSIAATVTGFCFRQHGHEVEVSWMANGAMQTVWVAEYRLSKARTKVNPPPPLSDVGGLQRSGL